MVARRTARAKPAPGRGKYERGRSLERRLEEQRARLLAAAAEVFAARGYARSTVETVVERAGMSRRTFYEHFDDLGHALLELHEDAAARTLAWVRARIEAESDPVEKLRAGVTGFLEMLANNGDLARVVFREVRSAGPQHEARREAVLVEFAKLLHDGAVAAHACGLARRPPDELTAFALVGAIESIGMRYVARREESKLMETAPRLVELVARALR